MERALVTRQELLEELLAGPCTKPELVRRVSISRSTVDRGISDLLEQGCVEKVNSRFELTETGRLALEARLEYESNLDRIQEATPLLDVIGPESVAIEFLRGATISIADPRRPWKALEPSNELVQEANTLYGTGPAAFRKFFDDLSRSVENHGLVCELILDKPVFDSFDSSQIEELRELIKPDGGSLFVTDLADSFALWVLDLPDGECAGITVYSTSGLEGIMYNDAPNAVSWAREQYRERKDAAELVWNFSCN